MINEAKPKEKKYVMSLSRKGDQEVMDTFIRYCKDNGKRWSTLAAEIIKEDLDIRRMKGEKI